MKEILQKLQKSQNVVKTIRILLRDTPLGRWYTSLHPLRRSVARIPLYLTIPLVVMILTVILDYRNVTFEYFATAPSAFLVFLFIWFWDFFGTWILYRLHDTRVATKLTQELNWNNFPVLSLVIILIWLYYMVRFLIDFMQLDISDFIQYIIHQPNPITIQLILLSVVGLYVSIFL